MLDESLTRSRIAEFRDRHEVPGVAMCLFSSRGPLFAVASGHANARRPDRPLTVNTLFRIYSITKMMTGTTAVLLADEGIIDLDAPVNRYLPELGEWRMTGGRGISLRDLLSHRSGLPAEALTERALSRDPDGLAATVLTDVPPLASVAAPGEVYSYSSIGISLAGLVLERATGMRFAGLQRKRLFEPLGMLRTTQDPAAAAAAPHAGHHVRGPDDRLRVGHDARLGIRYETSSLCYSTVIDVARFGAFHLAATPAVAAMHEPCADLRLDIGLRYGLTCYVDEGSSATRRIGHEGFFGGMWCKLLLQPGADLGVIWMDNRGEELREQRYDVIAQLFPDGNAGSIGPATVPGRRDVPADLPGRYERPDAAPVTVAAIGDRVELRCDNRRMRLIGGPRGSWVSPAERGPDSAPFGPHAGSRRTCLTPTRDRTGRVSHVHVNGVAYRRVGDEQGVAP